RGNGAPHRARLRAARPSDRGGPGGAGGPRWVRLGPRGAGPRCGGPTRGAELDFVRRADAEDHVCWAEGRGRGLFLRAAPISVAEAMRERLYGAVDTVVFTSATLRTGSSFEYFCRQVGLLDAEGGAGAHVLQLGGA